MCGIFGSVAGSERAHVNQDIFDALTALQHRGQDAAGMVTCDHGKLSMRKANGLVRDVFRTRHMLTLLGRMGIGHVRYPTAGGEGEDEAQPFYVNSPYGLSLIHNGNLTNADTLRVELTRAGRHLNTLSDSEVLLNVFAEELQKLQKIDLTPEDIFAAVTAVHERCRGAYAAIVMITDYGIVGFRDPFGIRPLVYGQRLHANDRVDYALASESVALDALSYQLLRDVLPGEAVLIKQSGQLIRKQCASHGQLSPCLFEYVYLARPDSTIDKILVYKVRLRLGERLAQKINQQWPNHDIDVVMPIPDTSRTAAHQLALKLQVKYREGFVKNRYIGRTFIMPGQVERRRSVRQKLNTINLEFRDKNVLLVDDSIVRGTTSQEIIQMARDAGAKKVYFASAAPEVRYPNVYGIDMPVASELIAHDATVDEICQKIGADWLIFQDLSALIEAAQEGNPNITRFEDSLFTGEYLTGDIDAVFLARQATLRSDIAKHERRQRTNDGL